MLLFEEKKSHESTAQIFFHINKIDKKSLNGLWFYKDKTLSFQITTTK